jgi:hypothetical protein
MVDDSKRVFRCKELPFADLIEKMNKNGSLVAQKRLFFYFLGPEMQIPL